MSYVISQLWDQFLNDILIYVCLKWLYHNHPVLAWHMLCIHEREGGRKKETLYLLQNMKNTYNPNIKSTIKKPTCFSWCSGFFSLQVSVYNKNKDLLFLFLHNFKVLLHIKDFLIFVTNNRVPTNNNCLCHCNKAFHE